jgi:hypothetical protein
MKFSGPVQLCTSNFWAGFQISCPLGHSPGPRQPISQKSFYSLNFCATWQWPSNSKISSCSAPEVSQKVFHTPVGQELREEIDLLETGLFLVLGYTLEAGWSKPPPPPKKKNNTCTELDWLFNFFSRTDRQADKQTRPPKLGKKYTL